MTNTRQVSFNFLGCVKIVINTVKSSQLDTTTTQENKVTITLIAVVVLFLICQTPAAVQLVYTMNNDTHTNLDIGELILKECKFS